MVVSGNIRVRRYHRTFQIEKAAREEGWFIDSFADEVAYPRAAP